LNEFAGYYTFKQPSGFGQLIALLRSVNELYKAISNLNKAKHS